MRIELSGRNVVYLSALSPAGLDFDAFEKAVGLGRPRTAVANPDLAIGEYDRLVVIVPPDGRVQLNFKPTASKDVCRRAAAELLRQTLSQGFRGVGFNGAVSIAMGEDDVAPTSTLVNYEQASERLGHDVTRAGVKLIYSLGSARITAELGPVDDDPLSWMGSINRHYSSAPTDAEADEAISWLAALDDELPALFRRLVRDSSEQVGHAA